MYDCPLLKVHCSCPSWLCLLLPPRHSRAFQKSSHFHLLGKRHDVSWGGAGSTLSHGSLVWRSLCTPRTEALKHTLSAPVSLGPSKASGTEVETNTSWMNKKTSSFRTHLLLLYGNSLINVMVRGSLFYSIFEESFLGKGKQLFEEGTTDSWQSNRPETRLFLSPRYLPNASVLSISTVNANPNFGFTTYS